MEYRLPNTDRTFCLEPSSHYDSESLLRQISENGVLDMMASFPDSRFVVKGYEGLRPAVRIDDANGIVKISGFYPRSTHDSPHDECMNFVEYLNNERVPLLKHLLVPHTYLDFEIEEPLLKGMRKKGLSLDLDVKVIPEFIDTRDFAFVWNAVYESGSNQFGHIIKALYEAIPFGLRYAKNGKNSSFFEEFETALKLVRYNMLEHLDHAEPDFHPAGQPPGILSNLYLTAFLTDGSTASSIERMAGRYLADLNTSKEPIVANVTLKGIRFDDPS